MCHGTCWVSHALVSPTRHWEHLPDASKEHAFQVLKPVGAVVDVVAGSKAYNKLAPR